MSSLRIAEIFHSLQGEGDLVGTPSTFIRVSGCNLRCVWCDTPYASWKPEGPAKELPEIVQKVSHHHVVVTGGEPMLFEAVSELCERLRGSGCHITIETAGTVYRDLPCDLMSISPKLANSLPPQDSGWSERHEKLRLDRGPLAKLMERYECQLKFVVTTPDDIKEIEDLVSQLPSIEPWRIMLMAEGTDRETLLERQRTLVQPCLDRGWRLTPRWHVDLFGNTRGT